MADDESDPEPQEEPLEDGEASELTPEQRDDLRRSADRIRRSSAWNTGVNLSLPAQLIPDSALNNFKTLASFATAQQQILNTIRPVLASQELWRHQIAAISSDVFKTVALHQTSLNHIASQLHRTIDFGFSRSITAFASDLAKQQIAWMNAIEPTMRWFKTWFYPENLRGIDGLTFEQVEEVVMVDGIPLYGVPRTSTAEALIHADSASKRRDILGRRWKTISADCREAVTACTARPIASYVPFAVSAIDALDSGHTEAAQALASSLVDAILRTTLENHNKYTPDRKGKRTKDAYDELTVRQFIAFAPMWQAYQQFFVDDGDAVPHTFSRHATAHTVSRRQYNRRNAVQALMFATSLLCHLNEECVRAAA